MTLLNYYICFLYNSSQSSILLRIILGNIIFGFLMIFIAKYKRRKNKVTIFGFCAIMASIIDVAFLWINCLIGYSIMEVEWRKTYVILAYLEKSLGTLYFIYACLPYHNWIYFLLLNLDFLIYLQWIDDIEGIYLWYGIIVIIINLKFYTMLRYIEMLFTENEYDYNFFAMDHKIFFP